MKSLQLIIDSLSKVDFIRLLQIEPARSGYHTSLQYSCYKQTTICNILLDIEDFIMYHLMSIEDILLHKNLGYEFKKRSKSIFTIDKKSIRTICFFRK